ncbi:hypothetical protein CI102_11138 [Trichoderma harzianum]|nr:hypothetical protein CI102_11138 [Trichoderma harzianum]
MHDSRRLSSPFCWCRTAPCPLLLSISLFGGDHSFFRCFAQLLLVGFVGFPSGCTLRRQLQFGRLVSSQFDFLPSGYTFGDNFSLV